MRKVFISLLSILLVLGAFTNVQAASFKDVPASSTFYKEINYLTSKKIISGYADGSFKPNEAVTRGQAATMISRALGLNGTQRTTKFKDVSKSNAASGHIQSAVDKGIIQGFSDGTFRPNQKVTRGQMAIFLVRAFNLTKTTTVTFKDVSKSSAAYPYIGKLLAAKITSGYSDNTFRPDQAVTRGQFSAFMARALDPSFISSSSGSSSKASMGVSFLNVGQGDAILIKFPNGKTMMVDAGRTDTSAATELNKLGIKTVDAFVATHPDADHIGGADYIIKNYNVKTVYDSGFEHTTGVYESYLNAVKASGASFKIPKIGQNISLDPNVTVKVLNVGGSTTDSNDASIVLMVTYGTIDYLLTGDIDSDIEAKLLPKYNLQAEVLKVAHHGSSTATSAAFLNEVKPQYAVLSYGEGNSYGHPASAVVQRLKNVNAKIVSTPNGTIQSSTNGSTLTVSGKIVTPSTPSTPSTTTTSVKIVSKDLAGEIVGIKNSGSSKISLAGWKLTSVEGDDSYTFPSGAFANAGQTVYVKSGPNAQDGHPYYKWTTRNMWNNSGDKAILKNASGQQVSVMN